MTRALTILVVSLVVFTVRAQEVAPATDLDGLTRALIARVTVGRGWARHCRHAEGGCEARMGAFAGYFTQSGERHGIDPWLLGAMAYRESSLNPFAHGTVGEAGIVQINPCNRMPEDVRRFIGPCMRVERTPARMAFIARRVAEEHERCSHEVGECQGPIVEHAATMLAAAIESCGGSIAQGLTVYNGAACGESDYANRVLREVEHLHEMAGGSDE